MLVHFIWPIRDDYPPPDGTGIDQIYHRKLKKQSEWDGGDPTFDPPLPGGSVCTTGLNCERPIIHDQPHLGTNGYDGTHQGRVNDSLDIQTITHLSIGIDRNDPGDPCAFGGYVYVVYAAEEPNLGYEEDVGEYVLADSNIYIVRSRDGGLTWSTPLRIEVPGTPSEEEYEFECYGTNGPSEPICGDPSVRRPIQFYPWVAVDKQGRVGVMWFDTWPDYVGEDANPCDANPIYNVHFAYSVDGGVTWKYGLEINDEPSQIGIGLNWGPLAGCRRGLHAGEYSGLSATSTNATAEGDGIFHAIWADFREYRTPWREDDEEHPGGPFWPGNMGDIYTTKVVVEDALFSMGDFDRDYDADMDDFANFTTCGVEPVPAECEILDMNRDNKIDNLDPYYFMQTCFTGPGEGESAGGGTSEGGEEDGTDPLDEMVQWCLAMMSAGERAELADLIHDAAEGVGAGEAARMNSFADAIDPSE